MRILFYLLFTASLFAQDSAIEKAVLAANAQATQAAEARDLDALFRFMLDTDKGSIVQNGALSLTPQQAKARIAPGFRAPVKVVYRGKQQYTVPFVQTAVWVLRDGAWKILHAHQSSPPR